MSSGVRVSDAVKLLFEEMKVMKKDADECQRLRFAMFTIADGAIIVDKVVREQDLEGVENHFQYFRDLLSDKKCCYALYDCHYENEESSKKEDLIFFMWAPDNADVKDKMAYASSKDPLSKAFCGVKFVKQINDPGEYHLDYFADFLGKNTVTIEGCSVKCSHKKGH
ncbi:non-muscle cofilin 1-like [Epinephelus moara]|uniref:non-muscle cofilin 1-like n=1 Tax=Epinephelus moara TaxID=300413 RepID=UPI00214E7F2F|nr:non-muscle cofilin 1-like [Epinephelus moara]